MRKNYQILAHARSLQKILISNFGNTLWVGQGKFQKWHIIITPIPHQRLPVDHLDFKDDILLDKGLKLQDEDLQYMKSSTHIQILSERFNIFMSKATRNSDIEIR